MLNNSHAYRRQTSAPKLCPNASAALAAADDFAMFDDPLSCGSPFFLSSEDDEASNESSSSAMTGISSAATTASIPAASANAPSTSPSLLASSVASIDSGVGSVGCSVSSSLGARRTNKKKKKRLVESLSCTTFKDMYTLTGDVLGEGSYGRVETCVNLYTEAEYAVKIISKRNWGFSRAKVLKEVELFYLCQGQKEIIQLVEYFEEPDYFYLVFEKAHGGPLLEHLQRGNGRGDGQGGRGVPEVTAAAIVRDLARALRFLHERGIAHRDLKPENILCVSRDSPYPVKLCDFDLCSQVNQALSTPLLQSPVGSAEYMAPEVVNAFASLSDGLDEDDDELTYDKKCDLWSLGVIAYVLLCGYLPFSASRDCGRGADCAWDRGGECMQCQRSLFAAIRSGDLVFPEQHWASISTEAKDLISRLLVKDATGRLDAEAVLDHPWLLQDRSGVDNKNKSTAPVCNSNRFSCPMDLQNLVLQYGNGGHHRRQTTATNRPYRKFSANLPMTRGGSLDDDEEEEDEDAFAASPANPSSAAAPTTNKMRRQTSLVFFPELERPVSAFDR